MEEEVEVPIAKENAKMETDDAPNETLTGKADVNMQDANPAAENGAPESGEKTSVEEKASAEVNDKPLQMDTDAKVFQVDYFFLFPHVSLSVCRHY